MFNYMNVGFVNNRTYDEKIHAKELGYGIRDCVMEPTDFEYDETNHRVGWGRAIMGGTPVRLGSSGEYFDLPLNYTGPVTLKRVLNGNASTVEMLMTEPGTSDDTTYYFKLYDATNGTIIQDYRSIDWVHSFELKNIGGSMFVWVLNGFTSEPFDASVLAGNRTYRLSPLDIGVPDNTLPNDVDAALVALLTGLNNTLGGDKGGSVAYDLNDATVLQMLLQNKINTLIGWGSLTETDLTFDFELTNLVGDDGVVYNDFGHVYLTDIATNKKYDLPINNGTPNWNLFSNGVYLSDIPTVLLATPPSAYTNSPITLTDSIYNFESCIIDFGPEDASYVLYEPQEVIPTISSLNATHSLPNSAGIDHWINHFTVVNGGMTLNPNADSYYTARYNIAYSTSLININTPGSHGILGIKGVRRIFPQGTSHVLVTEGDLTYRVSIYEGKELRRVLMTAPTPLGQIGDNVHDVALQEVVKAKVVSNKKGVMK